jgi:hypothetical protein
VFLKRKNPFFQDVNLAAADVPGWTRDHHHTHHTLRQGDRFHYFTVAIARSWLNFRNYVKVKTINIPSALPGPVESPPLRKGDH